METKQRRIKQKSSGFYTNKELFVFSIKNKNGARLRITNFAASILSLEVLDKQGSRVNVILGFDSIDQYVDKSKGKVSRYLGASIGRYAGRISGEKLKINSKEYPLYHEDGVHLHGGKYGFDEKVWDVAYVDEDNQSVTFAYYSEHLEEGYPGNLRVEVMYQLTDDNKLNIKYTAVSDQDTVLNLTNHAYYNLNGEGSVSNHILQLHCDRYLEVDDKNIPTGEVHKVVDTRFDYREEKVLSSLQKDGILDDTLIFEAHRDTFQGVVFSPLTGIRMQIKTNQPAVVIYTPEKFADWNFRKGKTYDKFPAICFETQNYPDAPNHSHFPSSEIKANERYENFTSFIFDVLSDQ